MLPSHTTSQHADDVDADGSLRVVNFSKKPWVSLRRLVFAETWYILWSRPGGFIQIHSRLPYLRDFEPMQSLQEPKPAWSLWKAYARTVLCNSSTGSLERCVGLQHRGTHSSCSEPLPQQGWRCHAEALAEFTWQTVRCQNFGTQTHRFPFRTRESNSGRHPQLWCTFSEAM